MLAERINAELFEVPVWQPVFAPAVTALSAPDEVAGTLEEADCDRRVEVERRAARQGLPAVRWPVPFPADTELAVRAAIFAQASGRAVAFSLAAFRQAFAGGRDLGDPDTVLLAAAACELHPRAVIKGIESRSIRARAAAAVEEAATAGVRSVPALRIAADVRSGDEILPPPAEPD